MMYVLKCAKYFPFSINFNATKPIYTIKFAILWKTNNVQDNQFELTIYPLLFWYIIVYWKKWVWPCGPPNPLFRTCTCITLYHLNWVQLKFFLLFSFVVRGSLVLELRHFGSIAIWTSLWVKPTCYLRNCLVALYFKFKWLCLITGAIKKHLLQMEFWD